MPQSLTPFESVLKDQDIVDEIGNRAADGRLKNAHGEGPQRRILERVQPGIRPEALGGRDFETEAIVLAFGRPSLLVRNGTFELPESSTWREILALSRPLVEDAIARVGRIELINSDMDWVGTGWLIDETIIATNRHVAVAFAEARGGQLAFRKSPFNSESISALVDFRQEHEVVESIEIPVAQVLYIAGEEEPDIAFLRIEADVPLPEPLSLEGGELSERQNIGVIGYPAYDSRNGEDAMRRYFDGKYNVKRFAPGRISDRVANEHYFKHDCTTLGGNSGSCVIDLETGRVVGLHYAGSFKIANYAVKTSHIAAALSGMQIVRPVRPVAPPDEALRDAQTHPPASYEGRPGYDPAFLGPAHEVALPELGRWQDDAAAVAGAPPARTFEARYQHFSVVQSRSRRMPILTACNIDGQRSHRLRRAQTGWAYDGRIDRAYQLGEEAYARNAFDRGHMVRRLDPVWGDEASAKRANDDTFHYVNAAPQHEELNQKAWLTLEDEVLDFAAVRDLKLTVLTGPVLRDTDKTYRQVKIPKEFWKIVALVDDDTDELSAAGFILSQGEMIKDFTEVPFVAERSAVYQVPITLIERATGLRFGRLGEHDAFVRSGLEEGRSPPRALRIRGGGDMRLTSRPAPAEA